MPDQFEAMNKLASAWVDRMLGPTYRERFSEDAAQFESAFVAGSAHTAGLIVAWLREDHDGCDTFIDVRIARGEWLPKDPEPALFTPDHDVETDDD